MIDITIDGHSVKIVGHARSGLGSEPCSRVSTIHQIMGELLDDKVKEYDDQNGYSYIKLDGMSKSEIDIFDKLCACYDKMASPGMYHRMVRVKRVKETIAKTADADKPKRGRKPANKDVK